MIIICENCTAKFKLDESLLNPNGSKVRCSQCAHLFIAYPQGDGPEKIIHPEMAKKKSSPEEIDSLKSDKSSDESSDENIPDERIDDLSFDPISDSDEAKLKSPQTELNAPFPPPEDPLETDDINVDEDLDLDIELDFSDTNFDFDKNGLNLDNSASDETQDMVDEALTKEDTPSHDSVDDLDLDLNLDMEPGLEELPPVDTGDMHQDSLSEKEILPFDSEEVDVNLDMSLDEEEMSATPEGIKAPDAATATMVTDENDVPQEQEAPPSKKDLPKEPGDDTPIAPGSTAAPLTEDLPLGTEKRSSAIVKFFIFFIFLLILLLGAHAASLMTGITIPYISDLNIPYLTEWATPKPPPPPPVRLVPDKKSINGRFEINEKEGTLFVITGKIHNTSQVTCTHIRVTGSLIDKEKAKIKSKTVVSGITIPKQKLATLDIAAMDKILSNPDPKDSYSLAPGQYSPFMIVFSKLPDNLENFTVSVAKFDKK